MPAVPRTNAKRAEVEDAKLVSVMCDRVITIMAEGHSLDACAALMGVSPDDLRDWVNDYPELADAARKGRAAGTALFERRLFDVAHGKRRGDARLLRWILANRRANVDGWSMRPAPPSEVATEPSKTVRVDLSTLSKEERKELRRHLDASMKLMALAEKRRGEFGCCSEQEQQNSNSARERIERADRMKRRVGAF